MKVCYKDTIFQPYSPYHHVAELIKALSNSSNPILGIYTDGGPDHRNTHLTVQISLFVSLGAWILTC